MHVRHQSQSIGINLMLVPHEESQEVQSAFILIHIQSMSAFFTICYYHYPKQGDRTQKMPEDGKICMKVCISRSLVL